MTWLSAIGEVAKTVRVIWSDATLLIKDTIRRIRIEKDIDSNSDLVDRLRKPADPERDDAPSE